MDLSISSGCFGYASGSFQSAAQKAMSPGDGVLRFSSSSLSQLSQVVSVSV
jgi:hypothetical protein